jgi:hypothetical protein
VTAPAPPPDTTARDAPWLHADHDDWLRHVLGLHFHPEKGAPYWLRRQRAWGIDVRREIRTVSDLHRLEPMPEDDLRRFPVTDFLPAPVRQEPREWILAETGGTLGTPKTTVYRETEMRGAFVDPFTRVAHATGFPRGLAWLFAGPTGPHIIGRAARENARALDSPEPFTLDFDPRWVRRLEPGSLARERYRNHVHQQMLRILDVQEIGVLFATPALLLPLAAALHRAQAEAIRGVFYGGMAMTAAERRALRQAFPNAVHLAGYGNTLLGLALQVDPEAEHLDYVYPGSRLVVDLVEREIDHGRTAAERLHRPVAAGEVGQVVASRLDESFLLLNLFERDQAERLDHSPAAPFPVVNPGLRNPEPLERPGGARPGAGGLY